jgi:DNA-binding NtrC family response regulator
MRSDSGATGRALLLIASDPRQVRLINAAASQAGWQTTCIPNREMALDAIRGADGQRFAVVILDDCTADENGLATVAEIKRHHPGLPVVMLTQNIDASHAVEAMKAGVSDYLLKPFTPDRLRGALRQVTSAGADSNELQPLSEKLDYSADFNSLVGADPVFRSALAQAAVSARHGSNVLVEGESGTGKLTLLRSMHKASLRAKGRIEVLNARAFSDAGLMSALFGHHKGAFPGAFETQPGAFQLCNGGTLVLQEVSRISPKIQMKLAKTIGAARVQPQGSPQCFTVDVRIFSSSNQALLPLVEAGEFDKSLYEMLSQTRIALPPLRQRWADIPALARHFMGRLRDLTDLELSINDDALRLLTAYEWPGNVGQLQTALLRASAICEGAALTAKDFPALSDLPEDTHSDQSITLRTLQPHGLALLQPDGHLRSLAEVEADIIRLAMGHYKGRMSEVARRLGLSRSTLYRKLANLSVDLPGPE